MTKQIFIDIIKNHGKEGKAVKKSGIIKLILAAISGAAAASAALRCIYELGHPKITRYRIKNSKITEGNGIRSAFISDLHGRIYGENNSRLLEMIRKEKPDVILAGGDLIVSKIPKYDKVALEFLKEAARIAPVYMAPGNHEKGMESLNMFKNRNAAFHERLEEMGVCYLSNEGADINESISVTGLDADYECYGKIHPKKLNEEAVLDLIGRCDRSRFNILLAHNPGFFEKCLANAPDLVLSGHYHGGAIRLPKIGGVISPQFRLFPKYSRGMFKKQGSTLIVSAGCGSHTINLRLFNRPEVVIIDICS